MSNEDGGPAFPSKNSVLEWQPDRDKGSSDFILTDGSGNRCGTGSVFMESHFTPHTGMSLRDWFAGQAMQGMASVISKDGKEPHYATLAMRAYSQADEMLYARNGVYRPGPITELGKAAGGAG